MKAIYLVCKTAKIIANSQQEAVDKFFDMFPDYFGPIIVKWQNWVKVSSRLPWAIVSAKGSEAIGTVFTAKRRAACL